MELLSSRSPNFQKWLECHSFIGKNLYSFFAADKLAKKFKNSPPLVLSSKQICPVDVFQVEKAEKDAKGN